MIGDPAGVIASGVGTGFASRQTRSVCAEIMLKKCGCSSMVEQQPSKLNTRVRFPSPAPSFLEARLPHVAVPSVIIDCRFLASRLEIQPHERLITDHFAECAEGEPRDQDEEHNDGGGKHLP